MKNDRDEYSMTNVVRVQAEHGEEPETSNSDALPALGWIIAIAIIVVIVIDFAT